MKITRSQIDELVSKSIEEGFDDRLRKFNQPKGTRTDNLNCDLSDIPDNAFMGLLTIFPGLFYKDSMAKTAMFISTDSPELKMTPAQIEQYKASARSKFAATDVAKIKKTLETVITITLPASAFIICSTLVTVSKIIASIIGIVASDSVVDKKEQGAEATGASGQDPVSILSKVSEEIKEHILLKYSKRGKIVDKIDNEALYIFPVVCIKIAAGDDASSYLDTRRLIFDNVVAQSTGSSENFYMSLSDYYDDIEDASLLTQIKEIINPIREITIDQKTASELSTMLISKSEESYSDLKRYL